jgi:cytochrome P450
VVQLARLLKDPHDFLSSSRARYGSVFTLRLPGQKPTVVVSEPQAVRQLVSAGYEEVSRFTERLRLIFGDRSVAFLNDAPHRAAHRLMLPPFQGDRMRAYGTDMAEIANGVIRGWRDGETRVLLKDMQEITLNVILRCVFGITDARRLGEFARLLVDYLDMMLTPWVYGASLALSSGRVRDFLHGFGKRMQGGRRRPSRWPILSHADHAGAIDAILLEEIVQCRNLSDAERDKRRDILSLMVAARYEDGSPMSDESLRDQLFTLLVAGHESTATSICWALDCALRHPGTIEKMRDEAERVFPEGLHDDVDGGRVKQLTYIGAVIQESMRLYPVVPSISRTLKKDTDIAGWRLPAGTTVSPSIFLVHREPSLWENPSVFQPERFLAGKGAFYEFFPFGASVWRCIGAQFADYEMRVVLSRVVTQFDLTVDAARSYRPITRAVAIIPSDGVTVRVHRRRERSTDGYPVSSAARG